MLDKKLLDDLKSAYQLDDTTAQNLHQFPTIALVLDNIQSFPSDFRPTLSIIKRIVTLHEQLNARNCAFSENAVQKCLTSVPARLVLEHYVKHQLSLPANIDELFDAGRLKLLFDLINEHQSVLISTSLSTITDPRYSFFSQTIDTQRKITDQHKILRIYFPRNDQFNLDVIEQTLQEVRGVKNYGVVMTPGY